MLELVCVVVPVLEPATAAVWVGLSQMLVNVQIFSSNNLTQTLVVSNAAEGSMTAHGLLHGFQF